MKTPLKIYNYTLVGSFGSIFSKSISLFDDLNEFSNLLVIFDQSILILHTFFTALSITKYIKKDLQYIFKTVLKIQVLILIAFFKSLQKYFFKTWFLEIYIQKNYMYCYNFCQ